MILEGGSIGIGGGCYAHHLTPPSFSPDNGSGLNSCRNNASCCLAIKRRWPSPFGITSEPLTVHCNENASVTGCLQIWYRRCRHKLAEEMSALFSTDNLLIIPSLPMRFIVHAS